MDEKTWVPLGLAVSIIGGAAFWLSAVSSQVTANAAEISRNDRRIGKYEETINQIGRDLAEIKVEIKNLNFHLRKRLTGER